MRRYKWESWAALLAASTVIACSANGDAGDDFGNGNGGAPADAQTGNVGGTGDPVGGSGGGFFDADTNDARYGADAACGYATIPTEREPGSILLVVDRSASMSRDPNTDDDPDPGDPSKWDLVYDAMQTVIASLPGEIRMGLLLYPKSGAGCDVDTSPMVPIGPVSTTGPAIMTGLGGLPWGDTPTDKALLSAYDHLRGLPGSGNRGAMLITDGAWNCGSNGATIYSMVEEAYTKDGITTFAIGIPGSATDSLSHLSHLGGSDRGPGCNPDLFVFDAAHPFQDNSCGSDKSTCCHYIIDGATFQTDLVAALEEIASQFLTSCVFMVPKDADPSKFDPDLVNVYVDGEIIPQGDDGWSYVGGGTDAIEIHGVTCDELLSGQKDQVEIELGCPTVVK